MVGFTYSELSEKKSVLIRKLAELEKKLAPIREEMVMVRSELKLINEIIGLKSTSEKTDLNGYQDFSKTKDKGINENSNQYQSNVEVEIEKILEKYNNPMHVERILEELLNNGVRVPGRGHVSNIIVRMRRCPEIFIRVAPGTYALKKWPDYSEMQPKRKSKRSLARKKR